jgi:predicted Zn-dependent peptidase
MAGMDSPLPMDEKCLHGKLKNGLTYYVQTNKKPIARCELRLVVKVGSVFETEEECGIAHMVEHLAFRGTAMYDTFEVVRFLETIGARFGACQVLNLVIFVASFHHSTMICTECIHIVR